MRECVEFRIREENAEKYLPPGTGESIGYGIRRVLVDTSDPLFAEIGRRHRQFRAAGKYFFSGREYHRRYSRREMTNASLFHAWPTKTFEPAGEECGTEYDDSKACSECGGGAPQTTPLFLDGRKIPKKLDFARTIADEVVISSRGVALFSELALQGVEFGPVRLQNQRGERSADYYQLTVVGPGVDLDPTTRVGEDPFDKESYGRCSRGDTIGLNLLSEVTVKRSNFTMADFMATRQRVGVRRGLLRPSPLLLLSPKAWRAIDSAKLTGLTIEVARVA